MAEYSYPTRVRGSGTARERRFAHAFQKWGSGTIDLAGIVERESSRRHVDVSGTSYDVVEPYTYILVTTGANSTTINLPFAANYEDSEVSIKKVDNGGGSVLIYGYATSAAIESREYQIGDLFVNGESGRQYQAGSFFLTLDPPPVVTYEQIDDASLHTLYSMNDTVTMVCDGVQWYILSRYPEIMQHFTVGGNTTLNTSHFSGMIVVSGLVANTTLTLPSPVTSRPGAWIEISALSGTYTTTLGCSAANSMGMIGNTSANSITMAAIAGSRARIVNAGSTWLVEGWAGLTEA